MEFISAQANGTTQTKTSLEQSDCLALGAFVGFLTADERLNLLSEKAADRSKTPSSNNLSFLNGLPVEADRHILFPALIFGHKLHVGYV
jgi:hypothetical protein